MRRHLRLRSVSRQQEARERSSSRCRTSSRSSRRVQTVRAAAAVPMAGPSTGSRTGRVCVAATVGPMSLHDQRAVEDQDLVDQSLLLIAIVDDQRVQADVHVNHLEAQVGDTAKTFCPILPKFGLAADHAVAVIEQLCGYGRREDDVIGKMAQQQLQVVGVPTLHPAVNEILRLNAIHAEIIAHRSKAVDLLILAALLGGTASGAA